MSSSKMVILNGIACRKHVKAKLVVHSENNSGKLVVKPFILAIDKDTDHIAWLETFIKSDEFINGVYLNKTVTVHFKHKGSEIEANICHLFDVNSENNTVKITSMLICSWNNGM